MESVTFEHKGSYSGLDIIVRQYEGVEWCGYVKLEDGWPRVRPYPFSVEGADPDAMSMVGYSRLQLPKGEWVGFSFKFSPPEFNTSINALLATQKLAEEIRAYFTTPKVLTLKSNDGREVEFKCDLGAKTVVFYLEEPAYGMNEARFVLDRLFPLYDWLGRLLQKEYN